MMSVKGSRILLVPLALIWWFFRISESAVEAELQRNLDVGSEGDISMNKEEEVMMRRGLSSQSLISLNPDDIQFFLFPDKRRPDLKVEIEYGNIDSLDKSGLIKGTPVVFFTHGFLVNISNGGCDPIKNALLRENYKNVMCVDWGKLAAPNMDILPLSTLLPLLFYPEVAVAMNIVGRRLGDFLIFLKRQKFVNSYQDFHLIGHSLGAHASGRAGKHILDQEHVKVGRISGLDPAGPLFQTNKEKFKLTKNKAAFVDIIHTDAGGFGTNELSGHVDFFANGGRAIDQPNCRNLTAIFAWCGHTSSINYFERAILREKLLGCSCKFRLTVQIKQPCPRPKTCKLDTPFGGVLPKSKYGPYYLPVPLEMPKRVKAFYQDYKHPIDRAVESELAMG